MQLSGSLSEYSLAELFSFIHKGHHTGLITLFSDKNQSIPVVEFHYLWFEHGKIIAVTNGLDGIGLLTKIIQRKLMSSENIEPVQKILYNLPQPLGIYLKSRGLLDAVQIKVLFNSQTTSSICKLFEVKNKQFKFEIGLLPINAERTGLSVPAIEIAFLGLRLLKDWSGLKAKMPDPNCAIKHCSSPLNIELNRHEAQLWKLADGVSPLSQLAIKIALPIETIQQICFRLITFNLIEEVQIKSLKSTNVEHFSLAPTHVKSSIISSSFLGNLKSFLRRGSIKR